MWDLRLCKMLVACRVWDSYSRVVEETSVTVCRGEWYRTFRWILLLPSRWSSSEVDSPGVYYFWLHRMECVSCHRLAITILMLLLHLCKIYVPILKRIVYLFCIVLTICGTSQGVGNACPSRWFLTTYHLEDFQSGWVLKCCSTVFRSRVEVLRSYLLLRTPKWNIL